MKFFVPGIPKPAGSKRGFAIYRGKKGAREFTGKVAVVDAAGQPGKDWRGDVKRFALEAQDGPLNEGPIELRVTFQMPRPKAHFTSKGLKQSAPHYHTIRPDCMKLTRGLEDALTGIIWKDDSQVAVQTVSKIYSDRPGAVVEVWGLTP